MKQQTPNKTKQNKQTKKHSWTVWEQIRNNFQMITSLRKSVPHLIHVQRSQNNHQANLQDMGVRGRLDKALHCKSRGQGSTPGHKGVKDRFSVHRSQHLYSLISRQSRFRVHNTNDMIVARVKDPTPTFWQHKMLVSSWSFTLTIQHPPFDNTRH